MSKLQSAHDVIMETLRDLEEFRRSGGKEAFKKRLREDFVRRSGAASLDEALIMGLESLASLLRKPLETTAPSRKRSARSPKASKRGP
jgi:hypothetical protein